MTLITIVKKFLKKRRASKQKSSPMFSISFLPIQFSRLATGLQSLPSGGLMVQEQRSSGALKSWGSSPGRRLMCWRVPVACSLETEWCWCSRGSRSGGWSAWLVCGQVSEPAWDSQVGLTYLPEFGQHPQCLGDGASWTSCGVLFTFQSQHDCVQGPESTVIDQSGQYVFHGTFPLSSQVQRIC